jgi:hypothetical protein
MYVHIVRVPDVQRLEVVMCIHIVRVPDVRPAGSARGRQRHHEAHGRLPVLWCGGAGPIIYIYFTYYIFLYILLYNCIPI